MVIAYCGSIEAQKLSALHAHMLLFICSVFLKMTTVEIAKLLLRRLAPFDDGMAKMHQWKQHCCSESLALSRISHFTERELDDIEEQWRSRHQHDAALLVHAHSPRVNAMDASEWRAWFDRNETARRLLCNLHVHPKDLDGERRVPSSCLPKSDTQVRKRQRARRTGIRLREAATCKYSFPKKVIVQPAVLCARRARRLD